MDGRFWCLSWCFVIVQLSCIWNMSGFSVVLGFPSWTCLWLKCFLKIFFFFFFLLVKTEETIWIQIPMLILHLGVNLFLSILLPSLHVACHQTSITSHWNSNVSSDWNLAIQEQAARNKDQESCNVTLFCLLLFSEAKLIAFVWPNDRYCFCKFSFRFMNGKDIV